MHASLEVTGLSKTYQDGELLIDAVKSVDLEVPRGQFLCVRGPSGSGKSTLLHMLAGLLSPTAGSIRIGDTEIQTLSESKRAIFRRKHIGVIFQFFNLIPHLTVEENAALPALLEGSKLRQVRPRVTELLEELGMAGRSRQRTGQLSGGELQRVAIARALIMNPDLVLADEPTGNLHREAAEHIYADLRDLSRRRHVTTVLVTHDPDAPGYADRVVQLREGVIEFDTTQAEGEAPPGS